MALRWHYRYLQRGRIWRLQRISMQIKLQNSHKIPQIPLLQSSLNNRET
nr:MAG TPA: hypothetical protein [Bacteriophage sp.]